MPSLRHRCRQPELMDQPGLSSEDHWAALRGLARINSWSGSAAILWSAIKRLSWPTGRPLRLLDVASGGGDVVLSLWKRARRMGLPLECSGCDISSVAVEYATQAAFKTKSSVRFFVHDAIRGGPVLGHDVVTCSLFLHHLDDDDGVSLLRNLAGCAPLVLVNDLERGRMNYLLVKLAARLLTRSPIVHVDAERSVAAAFTRAEAFALATRAGLIGARIDRRWPCRFLLQWHRP